MWRRRRTWARRRPIPAEKPRLPIITPATVIEAMPIGVSALDLEGKVLYTNEATSKMFEYSIEEAVGKPVIDFLPEEEKSRAMEIHKKGISVGSTKNVEFTGVSKTGRKFPILVDSTLVRDSEGNPTSVIWMFRDITESKRAEELKRAYGELVGLERAKAFTFSLFKDIIEPVLKECKPETIARIKELIQKFGEKAPIARGAKITDDGSVSFDEASFREAVAGASSAISTHDVVEAFSDIVNEYYPIIKADLGDEKTGAVFSNVFSAALEKPGVAPYKLGLLQVVPEGVEIPVAYRVLESGRSYLVEERTPEHAFAMFSDMARLGFPGLCISTMHPADVKREHDLRERATVLWISNAEKEFSIPPSSLGILRDRISSFIEQNEDSIVLLDGFEYLATTNGFDVALKFLHDAREDVVINKARLIVSISPITQNERELGLLERYMETIEVVEE